MFVKGPSAFSRRTAASDPAFYFPAAWQCYTGVGGGGAGFGGLLFLLKRLGCLQSLKVLLLFVWHAEQQRQHWHAPSCVWKAFGSFFPIVISGTGGTVFLPPQRLPSPLGRNSSACWPPRGESFHLTDIWRLVYKYFAKHLAKHKTFFFCLELLGFLFPLSPQQPSTTEEGALLSGPLTPSAVDGQGF